MSDPIVFTKQTEVTVLHNITAAEQQVDRTKIQRTLVSCDTSSTYSDHADAEKCLTLMGADQHTLNIHGGLFGLFGTSYSISPKAEAVNSTKTEVANIEDKHIPGYVVETY